MDKKEIQRKRTLRYFIDAAAQIIDEEDIDAITIRKVADIAGYNSATLYNYFENLNHLVSMAALKFVRDYIEALPTYIKRANNALEKTLLVWECFCYHSYKKPKIYTAIFVKDLNRKFPNYIKEFYEIYPEYLEKMPEDISLMLTKDDIYDRSLVLLKECAYEGFVHEKDLMEIDEMTFFIYKGMVINILNNKFEGSIEEAVQRTMKYITKIFKAYLISDYQL